MHKDIVKVPAPEQSDATEQRLRKAFRCAAIGVSEVVGKNVFHHLVEHIAKALGLNYAFIGVLKQGEVERVNVVALYNDGAIEDNFEYDLAETPCRNVIGQRYRYYPEKVTEQFADPHARELCVEGYAGIPLYSSKGEVLGVMAVMNREPLVDPDLTEELLKIFSVRAALELERMYATQTADEKSEQYLAIFNASVDGMMFFNDAGQVVDANPAFKLMHGYSSEHDFNGIDPFDFIPPESNAVYYEFMKVVREQGYLHTEGLGQRTDGSKFRVDIRGVRTLYRGKPHILAVVRDITQDKRREAALIQSEDRFRATVEAALDCIISMDQAGNIVEFNPAAEKTFGYSRAQVIGKSLADTLIPQEFRERHEHGMQRYLAGGVGPFLGKRVELQALRADKTRFPIELSIDVARSADETIFIGYIRDITERKKAEVERMRLEAQLRQAQKMEAIGHLTGGVAHDFNNILTGIMGYIVMAQEWEEKHKDEKLHRYLDRAQKSGQRARDLIQQMLTFSRGQRGEPRALNPVRFVTESIALLESSLPSSIEIRLDANPDVPRVMVDPVHFGQVFMNLCINARDAMNGTGVLDISLRQIECKVNCICSSCRKPMQGKYVELSVRDNGPGISKEQMDRIFEPFYTTKEVGKGSGMGLSTVHGIVHEHHGHIVVESEPGKGAKFAVVLPIASSSVEETDSDDSSTTDTEANRLQGRILLVEDDAGVSEYMQEQLTDWGLSVTAYANGPAALAHLQQDLRGYDLYLLDYTMPKMTGLEVAEKIRAHYPNAGIIIYTGYSDDLSDAQLEAAGIHTVLRKPVDPTVLREHLTELLGRRRSKRAV